MSTIRLLTDGELDEVSGGGYIQNAINTKNQIIRDAASDYAQCIAGCHGTPDAGPNQSGPHH